MSHRSLEIVVVVVAAVLVMTWTARRLRLSEPMVLLAGGCLIGLVPHFGDIPLPPEVVLLIFLPALLYYESLTTSLREIRANLRSITLQATGLVMLTTAAVAAVAHAFGFPWPVAFVLGAVLGPTDAVAVAAVARGLPRRTLTMLRAESLINDGTALVLLAVTIEAAVQGTPFSWSGTALHFAVSCAGGIAVGLATAAVVILIRRRWRDPMLNSGLSVLTPFAAFMPAELLHASGVLAVVTCGLALSQAGPRLIPPVARLQVVSFWEVTTFLVNGSLFVLVGIQLPAAVRGLSSFTVPQAALLALAVSAMVISIRLLWFYTVPYLVRLLDRRPRQRERRIGARHRLPLAWAGMRGAISLAAALSVPTMTAGGLPVQDRDAIVFITTVVILVTLVILSPPLPAVIRWARLPADPTQDEEERLALRQISRAAVRALPEHAARLNVPAHIADELARDLGVFSHPSRAQEVEHTRQLALALLQVKRATLIHLRDRRHIDDIVLRRLQARLDAEQLRLETLAADAAPARPSLS
ncbi:Na+/H+ antiporter [Nonomuraea lactucae]|uniref:Na+/H+ antiporter n=1 Tax=Nonomuraea lactucae TaxID=2249762 RepID=UPI000DE4DEFA|nr:Na+/H+ antiporter [Nonomuraea lactucae]